MDSHHILSCDKILMSIVVMVDEARWAKEDTGPVLQVQRVDMDFSVSGIRIDDCRTPWVVL